MELNELIKDCSQRQKKGLHFIMASVVVWGLILGVHLMDITIEHPYVLAILMVAVETVFSICLYMESMRLRKS